jgi:hypothetical protein
MFADFEYSMNSLIALSGLSFNTSMSDLHAPSIRCFISNWLGLGASSAPPIPVSRSTMCPFLLYGKVIFPFFILADPALKPFLSR